MVDEILNNPVAVTGILAFAVFLLTQGLKWALVKPWTSKIKNEKIRKGVNTVVLLMPFVLGCLVEYLYCTFLSGLPFDPVVGITRGMTSIAMYSIFDHFLSIIFGTAPTQNPYTSDEGQAAVECAEDVISDGKVDSEDISAVKKLLSMVDDK